MYVCIFLPKILSGCTHVLSHCGIQIFPEKQLQLIALQIAFQCCSMSEKSQRKSLMH